MKRQYLEIDILYDYDLLFRFKKPIKLEIEKYDDFLRIEYKKLGIIIEECTEKEIIEAFKKIIREIYEEKKESNLNTKFKNLIEVININ